VHLAFARTFGIRPYIWHSPVHLAFARTFGIRPYIWHSPVHLAFARTLKKAAGAVCAAFGPKGRRENCLLDLGVKKI
ncbi:MAG: hypothetical protein SWX82_33585, partial [Cyanobacteriota bacterium]|nr:hypothetical protein [Cyanobacteriota bacterium]